MNSLNEELVRMALLGLMDLSRNGTHAVTPETRQLFEGMTPIEIEHVVTLCRRHVNVDMRSIEKTLLRVRKESLVRELIMGGASNSLIREVFGFSPRDLAQLRAEARIRSPSRKRLKPDDIRRLEARREQHPPGYSLLSRSVWSLDASRELGMPLMSVYRHINSPSTQDHEQG